EIIDPFRPVFDLLNSDTKLLTQIGLDFLFDQDGDRKVTLIELAAGLSGRSIDTSFFKAIEKIDDLNQQIRELGSQAGEILLDFGSFDLPNFDATGDGDTSGITPRAKGAIANIGNAIDNLPTSGTTGRQRAIAKGFTDDGDFDVPVLTDPFTALGLLLETPDTNLFTYDMPELAVGFEISRSFPIFGPISGLLEGQFELSTDLGFGYDTFGLNQWSNDGFAIESADSIFNGFFVSDRANADGTGADVSELALRASLAAGAGLDVLVASGFLKGGIQGIVGIDLVDVGEDDGTDDGKIRAFEIGDRLDTPWELFDISGTIEAFLGAEVNFLGRTVYDNQFAAFEIAQFGTGQVSSGASRAIDGAIVAGQVFFDANFNGILDSGEPFASTSEDGTFNLDIPKPTFDTNFNGVIDPSEGRIVVAEGVDTSTFLDRETPMYSLPNSAAVTPLTTLVTVGVQRGTSAAQVQAQLKSNLDLPDVDLLNYDPLEAIAQNEADGLTVFVEQVKVQSVIDQTTSLLRGAIAADNQAAIARSGQLANATTDREIAEFAIEAVADALLQDAQPTAARVDSPSFDLSNAATVESILQNAATKAGTTLGEDVSSGAAQIVAEGNQDLDATVPESVTAEEMSDETFFTTRSRNASDRQFLSSGSTSADLQALGGGEITSEEAIANNTGESVDALIEREALGGEPGRIPDIADTTRTAREALTVQNSQSGNPEANGISGGLQNDAIDGRGGADIIAGEAGDDALSGGDGSDLILGGSGDDILEGNGGNDALLGNSGDDVLDGGAGVDTLEGGSGEDTLGGGEDTDFLYGNASNDLISGDEARDFLFGGSGDDILDGGTGND
ncbi:MAG: calcium-binding protein, partial [Cyanobacteria bacterium J06639_1]